MPDRPCTVVYLIDDLSYGGAQKQLSILAERLPPPFRPAVVCMSERTEPFGTLLGERGVPVFALRRRSPADLPRLGALVRVIRRTNADVVHGFLDASNAYAYAAARLAGRPVVLSLRNERLRLSGGRAAALGWMMRRADRVIVNSRTGETLLAEAMRVPREKILYVRNWIAGIPSPRDGGPAGGGWVIGNIGRWTAQKQLHLLIEAFHAVRARLPGSRLVLVGRGEDRGALERRTEELGLAGSVEFLEPRVDVESVLRRLHCVVMPSAYEGMPNAAIEALSLGIPIVVSRAGDVADLVVGGETGILLPNNDPATIAGAVLEVLESEELRAAARREGPALVRRLFSIERAFESLLPAYASLARR